MLPSFFCCDFHLRDQKWLVFFGDAEFFDYWSHNCDELGVVDGLSARAVDVQFVAFLGGEVTCINFFQ